MSTLCNQLLAENLDYRCGTGLNLIGRLDAEAYIFNASDITSVTLSAADVVTALEISKKLYLIQVPGNKPYNGTGTTMEQTEYGARFTHTFQFVIPQIPHSGSIGPVVDEFANGDFGVIVKEYTDGGNYNYRIIGLDTGLKATAVEQSYYDDSRQGAWLITLTEEGATHSYLQFMESSSAAATWIANTIGS